VSVTPDHGRPVPPEVLEAWRRAERLYGAEEVEAALDGMAAAIGERLGGSDPVVLCVMVGGLVPAGRLLTRLDFPLCLDYVHATRYRGGTRGQALEWSVHSAVLVDKRIGRPRALERADFTGLTVPDRYVFGYGMDYRGYLRNAPGIYALAEPGGG